MKSTTHRLFRVEFYNALVRLTIYEILRGSSFFRVSLSCSTNIDDHGTFIYDNGCYIRLTWRRRAGASVEDNAGVLNIWGIEAFCQGEGWIYLFLSFSCVAYPILEGTKGKAKPSDVKMDELVGNTDGFADSGFDQSLILSLFYHW